MENMRNHYELTEKKHIERKTRKFGAKCRGDKARNLKALLRTGYLQ